LISLPTATSGPYLCFEMNTTKKPLAKPTPPSLSALLTA
jgi:hypothetical protein